jgi:copper(I)-binding protein
MYRWKNKSRAAFGTAVFAISLTIGSPGSAQTVGNLTISKSWIAATPPSARAAIGFLVISNNGAKDDILTEVEFTGAKKTEIHKIDLTDGVMRMRPQRDGIPIPAGETIALKPGKIHLMIMGLKMQLKDGQKYPVKLTFGIAGESTLEFPVLAMAKGKKLMLQEE